ncbi:uncharacterized protein VTP21DRAFT_10737 [Calcarisporiella thermophila]|uniref:uncharacterized protein n=1 Tax=Calcarisporiella thermophila TaxID=911321 RepID=UPI0037425201
MSAEEDLANYKYQLDQVELALAKDPNNQDFLKLKADLTDLINLTQQILQPAPTSEKKKPSTSASASPVSSSLTNGNAPSSTTSKDKFQSGDEVMARWSGDNQFYPATVVASQSDGYVVTFKGYGTTEKVLTKDVEPVEVRKKRAPVFELPPGAKTKKAKTSTGKEAGKKKTTGGEEKEKQKAWQQFTQKAAKKKASALGKKSIFATPDNPHAKVGVTGSGKPMTSYQQRGKHIFDKN